MTPQKYEQIKERFQRLPSNVREHLNDDWHNWLSAMFLARGESRGMTPEYVLKKSLEYQGEGSTYLLAKHVNLPKNEQTELVIEHERNLNCLADEVNGMLTRRQIDMPKLQEICEEAFVHLYGETREEHRITQAPKEK